MSTRYEQANRKTNIYIRKKLMLQPEAASGTLVYIMALCNAVVDIAIDTLGRISSYSKNLRGWNFFENIFFSKRSN